MSLYKVCIRFAYVILLAVGLSGNAISALKIVIVGSSTAYGVGPHSIENSWAFKYASYIKSVDSGSTVVNLAVPGYSTYKCMPSGSGVNEDTNHNITAALKYNPDVIIVSLTSNDANLAIPIEQTQSNFITIFNTAIKAGVPIYITSTSPRNLTVDKINVQIKTRDWIFSTFKDRSIDFWTTLANEDGTINDLYNSGDNIHFNDAGHEILFRSVLDKNILKNISLTYYSKPSGHLSDLTTWGINSDGTGFNPVSFLKPFNIFNLSNRAGTTTILDSQWTIRGHLKIAAGHRLMVTSISN